MKKIIFLILISRICFAQTFEWAQKFGTNGIPESVHSLITDNEGNFYIAGVVSGTFNNATSNNHMAYFGDTVLAINGADDIFIAKYSPIGNLIWAKTFGGDYDWNPSDFNSIIKRETINSLYYDKITDQIFVSGTVAGNCSIGSNTISNSSTSFNSFIACFNKSGVISWARQIGVDNQDSKIILSGANDKLFFSGISNSNFIIDNIQISNGAFLGILNTQGNCINAKTIAKKAAVTNLAVSDTTIFLTVSYGNQDSILIGDSLLPIDLNRKGFCLVSFNKYLDLVWLKNFYSYGWYIEPFKLKLVESNKLVFLTSFVSDIYSEADTILYSPERHVLFSEYSLLGVKISFNTEIANHLGDYLTYDNKLIAAGGFLGQDSICSVEYNSENNWSLYLTEFDANFMCLNSSVMINGCNFSITLSADSSIIIAGIIGSPGSDCGNCTSTLNLGNISLTSAGSTDGFIAKFNGFTSGIDDRSRKSKNINESLLIYANPSNGKCDIDIPDEFLHEKELKLSIYSSTGVLIQQATVNMNEETIKVDIQQEAKGMYNATLSNGKKVYQGRIVFE
jgi:hypothetical protein